MCAKMKSAIEIKQNRGNVRWENENLAIQVFVKNGEKTFFASLATFKRFTTFLNHSLTFYKSADITFHYSFYSTLDIKYK